MFNLYLLTIFFFGLIVTVLQKRANQKNTFLVVIALLVVLTLANLFVYPSTSDSTCISETLTSLTVTKRQPRVFCIIFTAPKKFKEGRPLTVLNVWATKCHNYRYITVMPNYTKPILTKHKSLEVEEPLNIMQPADLVKEDYWKLTYKVFMAFKQIHAEFGSDYDWFLKADDDTFIHVENLVDFLSTKDHDAPITFGYDFKVIVDHGYHSGGAGYVLSKEAFGRLGRQLEKNQSYCQITGTEDVDVARCLRRLGVYPNKSIDEQGRERFHPLDLGYHYLGGFPEWLIKYAANPVQKGLNCCSDSFISFHYMQPNGMTVLKTAVDRQTEISRRSANPRAGPKFKDIVDDFFAIENFQKSIK